jgi:hypothetical protein
VSPSIATFFSQIAEENAHIGMGTSSMANSSNSFGDNQLKIDLIANDIMFQKLQVISGTNVALTHFVSVDLRATCRAMLPWHPRKKLQSSCPWFLIAP